ncbi:MAG: hypothetical protein HDT44_05790 [Ruminococcaceae bacterium]|nr:hypothetical protein [Oscillospiraceae bacterium]
MEELLAYAYLLCEGFDLEEEYEEKLHELFLKDTTHSEDLLTLEGLCGKMKESTIYIRTHINYSSLDREKFGKTLMTLLKPFYQSMDIEQFGQRMYSVWEGMAGNLQEEEPFSVMCYADDPLSWGDEKQTRELYEKMLNYYD